MSAGFFVSGPNADCLYYAIQDVLSTLLLIKRGGTLVVAKGCDRPARGTQDALERHFNYNNCVLSAKWVA